MVSGTCASFCTICEKFLKNPPHENLKLFLCVCEKCVYADKQILEVNIQKCYILRVPCKNTRIVIPCLLPHLVLMLQ